VIRRRQQTASERGSGQGTAHPRQLVAAIANHERAIAWRMAARLGPAERACRRALAGYLATEGPRHPDVANALVDLGAILEARDRPREAARSHRRALAILTARRALEPDLVRLTVHARLALAGLDRARGALGPSGTGYRRALRDIRRRLPAGDRLLAHALNGLGVLRKAEGRYAEALAYYRRALVHVARGDRTMLATIHHNLGGSEHARGRHAMAEVHARRSVRLRAALVGPEHPALAGDLAALAAIVEARGHLDQAADLYARALAIFRRTLGGRSVEVGLTLASLAGLEHQRARTARARGLFTRALAILETLLGRHHADVALTINNLGVLERDAGHGARADRLFRRAVGSFERTLGGRHAHTRAARRNLGEDGPGTVRTAARPP
jgi:tetratricopeptide (TPR) repeat protein